MSNITRMCIARVKRERAHLEHTHGNPTLKDLQRYKASLIRLEQELALIGKPK